MAEVTGVTAHTLRYYERAGLIHPITRTVGNQRRYQRDDVDWVRFLVRLRETGMPIAQMRNYAALRSRGESTLPARLTMMTEHQQAVRQRIKWLRDHERALAATIATHQQMIDHVDESGAGKAPTSPVAGDRTPPRGFSGDSLRGVAYASFAIA
ncbi:MerR family transcriptional regulator [Brachybacterium tyrofermentans]|uniref:MerR family transcriptional regulator n=1 Tax=Brachybacterium tyrofermentans TaxID=47848 RepID=UPI003FD3365E